MEVLFLYVRVFITGGVLCLIAQLLIEFTKLTPARILVLYVTSGVLLTAVGLYQYIVDFGEAGATVPLIGFGYVLAEGVKEAVRLHGVTGIFTGALTASAAGITAAIFFGLCSALVFKGGDKS